MADWIARDIALHEAIESAPAMLGLDTEFMRIDTFWPKLALVQIEIAGRVLLIDPVADVDPAPLASLLGDGDRITTMHSASEDIDALARWNISIGHLFDTQIAAAFAGLGAGLGYQSLVRVLLGVELPKGETRSDWLRRPLSEQQLEYAAQDVIHLPALHEELATRIAARGFEEWLAADCAALLARARLRSADANPQLALRGAAEWPRERQALLRRVLRWRDVTARTIDRPRPWLLDDAHALDLCSTPPATLDELTQRTRGLRALRSTQRQSLFDALHAEADDDGDLKLIAHPPSPADKKIIAAMKDVVGQRASALDVPEGLLCARRHLETLLARREWPSAIDGWRREVLQDGLLRLLPD